MSSNVISKAQAGHVVQCREEFFCANF
jgi:hypothetical protein